MPASFEPLTQAEAEDLVGCLIAIPGFKIEAVPSVASDLVELCRGFQGYEPAHQAAWLINRLKTSWDEWHGPKLMREIFDGKFTIYAPDPRDKWKKEAGRAASPFAAANASAYDKYATENEAIMERARRAEKERAEKNVAVRKFLKVRDLSDVTFEQRWWAEMQLGYTIDRLQREDVDRWLSCTPEPHVVRKPGTQRAA